MTESPHHLHPRLLLVEDDPISRRFLQTSLQTLPAHVDWADSSTSALTLSRHHHHHLWLIDLNLPDGGGTELLSSLRRLHPNTPALAHTAEANLQLPMTQAFSPSCPNRYRANVYWKPCATHFQTPLWKTTHPHPFPHIQTKTGTKRLD